MTNYQERFSKNDTHKVEPASKSFRAEIEKINADAKDIFENGVLEAEQAYKRSISDYDSECKEARIYLNNCKQKLKPKKDYL